MMSIILVNPPSLYHMPKFGAQGKLAYFELSRRQLGADGFWSLPGEHLGLRSIQAACAIRGIDVEVINGQVLFHRSTAQTWDAIRASARQNGAPVLVGFSGPCQVFEENLELAAHVKRAWPDCLTVLGHDFATLNYERILGQHPEFDVVCLGEAEDSFPSLADAILNGGDPAIPGIASRGRPPHPASILDIDKLPWPARGELAPILAAGLSAAVFTARGCPYRCTFCTTGQNAARLPAATGTGSSHWTTCSPRSRTSPSATASGISPSPMTYSSPRALLPASEPKSSAAAPSPPSLASAS
jgi:hypothetical protein